MGDIGKVLKEARLQLGVDLRQASADTRISHLFLTALEEERFSDLPAAVYVRGFLRSYAGYLGLDGQELIDLLPEPFAAQPPSPQMGFVPGPRRGPPDPWRRPQQDEGGDVEERAGAASSLRRTAARFPGRRTVGSRRGRGTGGEVAELESVPPPGPPRDPRLPADRGDTGNQIAGLLLLSLAVIIAGGVIGGLFLLATRGDGGTPIGISVLDTPTAASRTGTIVPPPGTGTASVAPSATGTAAPAGSPPASAAVTTTPTTAAGGAITPRSSTPVPTATNTQPARPTPQSPTATATPPPPTPTPTPPPPTPTPTPPPPTPTTVPHPRGYDECEAGICGGPTIRIVCAPDGWFVDRADVGGQFPADEYGWPWYSITRTPGVSIGDAAVAACS